MVVLVACESSERVKKAFLDRGHDAHSCDYKPGEQGLPNHHQCDVRELLSSNFAKSIDLLIAHPDCTTLANSGVRWLINNLERMEQMRKDAEFFNWLLNRDIPHIAIGNPIQHKYARELIRIYDQIIQPWWFGEGETKATCLWLKNLPPLMASLVHPERKGRIWREPPSSERKTNRARTYIGLAEAMASQWGYII